MLQRPPWLLLRSISLAEFNAYLRLMLDRQRDAAEAEAEAEPEIDLAELSEDEFAALFGARKRKANGARRDQL